MEEQADRTSGEITALRRELEYRHQLTDVDKVALGLDFLETCGEDIPFPWALKKWLEERRAKKS